MQDVIKSKASRNRHIVDKVLLHMNEHPPPNVIAVFTLHTEDIPTITSAITESLPLFYSSTVRIDPIEKSTTILQSVHSRGTKTYRVVYDPNVFRFISPEQFLSTHYRWLQKEVGYLYRKNGYIKTHLLDVFSEEDAFQEMYFYLDGILSKFINPDYHSCNLRTYVANRLRRYFEMTVEKQLKARLNLLKAQASKFED